MQISVKEVRPDRRGIVGFQLEREGDGAVRLLHGLTQRPRADAREAMRRHGPVVWMRAEPWKTQRHAAANRLVTTEDAVGAHPEHGRTSMRRLPRREMGAVRIDLRGGVRRRHIDSRQRAGRRGDHRRWETHTVKLTGNHGDIVPRDQYLLPCCRIRSNLAVSATAMTAITPAWTGSLTTRSAASGTLPTMFSEMTGSPLRRTS